MATALQNTSGDYLTKEQLQDALPPQMKKSVSDALVDQVNQLLQDPELALNYRENVLNYTRVMQEGKYKLVDYLNAVRYVSHKMLGDSNFEAYSKVFPDRIANFQAQGYTPKKISSYVSAYNNNKLVTSVYGYSLTPSHILNAPYFQQAVNVQVELMNNVNVSPKVRTDAANSLLNHLKRPETHRMELDITHKEDDTIKQLRDNIRELSEQQRKLIESGGSDARTIAHSQIVAKPVYEDDEEDS